MKGLYQEYGVDNEISVKQEVVDEPNCEIEEIL
jgi:hypothetical protein